MYLVAKGTKRSWYLDSDYSRHITGDKEQFVTLEIKKRGMVTCGDNDKGHIVGIGKIWITLSTFIENVLYVRGLKHNLISISQLCDKDYKVSFEPSLCIVTNLVDDSIVLIRHRQGNVYMINLNNISISSHCLIATEAKINKIS